MKTPATYTVPRLRCRNCRWEQHREPHPLRIPRGQAVKQTACPDCGCKTLYTSLV